MATALNTKPGINGANVLSIPTEWDATWFRHFINNSLKGADVRNAIAGAGITITGNISSPYATISATGGGGGVSQIVAGTNITISPPGGTGVVTINSSGGGGGSGTVTSVSAGSSDIVIGGTPTVAPTVDLSAAVKAELGLAGSSVQSVSLTDASTAPIFSTSSTGTTAVALTETLINQAANLVFAGPASGGAAQPSFRSLVAADFSGIGGSGSVTVLQQSGGASQVYTVPANAVAVRVICIGAGGGGGSGARGAATSGGGGGGGAGGVSIWDYLASELGASQTVTFSNVATGGNGGAAQTTSSTAGNVGVTGSDVRFGNLLRAVGGIGGGGGPIGGGGSAGAGGQGNVGQGTAGGSGGGASAGSDSTPPTVAVYSATSMVPMGGGGGGGAAVGIGNPGGRGGAATFAGGQFFNITGGAAGAANTTGTGTAGGNGTSFGFLGSGGGGGGSGANTNNGLVGGIGANFGGGGGGGGGCENTGTTSGAGGQGGPAACIIIAYFAIGSGGVTSVAGTANQIDVSTVGGVATLSLDAALILPGTLVINPTAGQVSITVNGAPGQEGAIFQGGANGDAVEVLGSSTSGQSFGLFIGAGSTSADYAIKIQPHAGGVNYLQIKGDGSGTLGPSGSLGLSWDTIGQATFTPTTGATSAITVASPNGGPWALQITRVDLGTTIHLFNNAGVWFFNEGVNAPALMVGSPTGGMLSGDVNITGAYRVNGVSVTAVTGSFTGTFTGLVGGPTVTCKYTVTGNSVTLFIPSAGVVTSNATSFTLTGLPAAIQPTTKKYACSPNNAVNSGSVVNQVSVSVSTSIVTFLNNGSTTGWTGTGTKAWGDTVNGATITYDLT
jgi:hypothetical protein